jgi:hypothetical protein
LLECVSSSNTPPRGRGRPDKDINYCSNASSSRRNHELTVVLGLAEEERLELVATLTEQEKALVALSSSRRDMDYLKMKASALEEKHATVADKLVEAQEQVDASMAEASVSRGFLGISLFTTQQKEPKMQLMLLKWRLIRKIAAQR